MRRISKKFRLYFVATALSFFASSSFAKTAYVGVAGAGAGQGMMGHVFLVIADEPGQILNAVAYQYAIKLPPDLKFNVDTVLSLGSFPFMIDRGPAWRFIKNYNKEDRVVLLYELRLSDDQVTQLVAGVDEDKKQRDEFPHLDYSVDSSNCATKVYDQINILVPLNMQIQYISPIQALYKFEFFQPRQISMAIPLGAAPKLEHHPLVKNVIRFRQQSLADLEIAVAAFANLKPIFYACKTSVAAQDILAKMYGNTTLRQSEGYLKIFSGFFQNCVSTDTALKDVYNEHLDFIRMGTDDKQFLQMSELYYLR